MPVWDVKLIKVFVDKIGEITGLKSIKVTPADEDNVKEVTDWTGEIKFWRYKHFNKAEGEITILQSSDQLLHLWNLAKDKEECVVTIASDDPSVTKFSKITVRDVRFLKPELGGFEEDEPIITFKFVGKDLELS